jgi:hypothetical protein
MKDKLWILKKKLIISPAMCYNVVSHDTCWQQVGFQFRQISASRSDALLITSNRLLFLYYQHIGQQNKENVLWK